MPILMRIAALVLFAAASPALPSADCAAELRQIAETSSYLIGMAGNASGSALAREAHALGFQTLHLRLEDVDPTVVRTFPKADVFAHEWKFWTPSDLPRVVNEIESLTRSTGRPLRGASPGMDLAVYATDFVSAAMGLEGNSIEAGDWRTDKVEVNRLLGRSNLQTPFTRNFPSPEQLLRESNGLPYPLLVKPTRGSGSVGAGTFEDPVTLSAGLMELVEENRRRRNPDVGLMAQEALQPSGYIPFINTLSYRRKNGEVRRIVTGIWEDVRGDDFPKEVWDAIYMVPAEKFLSGERLKLFQRIQKTNERVLTALGVEVGTTHNEYMGNPLLLIDANWRLPGLDSSRLEWLATGINPYHLEMASRALPEILDEFPNVYTFKNEVQPALVFVRSHDNGVLTDQGADWFEQQMTRGLTWLSRQEAGNPRAPDQPVVIKRGGIRVGTSVSVTQNGRSIVEWMQVVGRDRQSVEDFVRDVRLKERNRFFVRPN